MLQLYGKFSSFIFASEMIKLKQFSNFNYKLDLIYINLNRRETKRENVAFFFICWKTKRINKSVFLCRKIAKKKTNRKTK